jgi:hypothetical protein
MVPATSLGWVDLYSHSDIVIRPPQQRITLESLPFSLPLSLNNHRTMINHHLYRLVGKSLPGSFKQSYLYL